MKKKQIVTTLLIAVILSCLLTSFVSKAKEGETNISEMISETQLLPNEGSVEQTLSDESCGFDEGVGRILKERFPAFGIGTVEAETWELFLNRMTIQEFREFVAFYKHCILTDAVEYKLQEKQIEINADVIQQEIKILEQLLKDGKMDNITEEERTKAESDALNLFEQVQPEKEHEQEQLENKQEVQKTDDILELAAFLDKMEQAQETEMEEVSKQVQMLMCKLYEVEIEAENQEQGSDDSSVNDVNKAESHLEEAVPITQARSAASARAVSVARVGNNYYASFNAAFNAMPDGGTMYVLRDCNVTHIVTEKSFSIYPEGQNVTVTFQVGTGNPAGIITTAEGWKGRPTWNLGGNGGYTLTFNANRRAGSGVLACYGATINLFDGVRLTNSSGNGIWNDSGITNVYEGSKIYNNGAHGIASFNTINIYGGEIYGNAFDGMRAQKFINVSGGNIHDNGECGIHVGENASTFTMTGGSTHHNMYGVGSFNGLCTIYIKGGDIQNNRRCGVSTNGRFLNISGGDIHNNLGTGVEVNGGEAFVQNGNIYSNACSGNGGGIASYSSLAISGGSIYGNLSGNGGGVYIGSGNLSLSGGLISDNTASTGNGIYFNGASFFMNGNGAVDTGNDVYLGNNKYITITDGLNASQAAVLTVSDYKCGRKVAEVAYGEKQGSQQFMKYALRPYENYCLRPGTYQIAYAGTQKADIVLSTSYTISYEKNYVGNVINMPGASTKYWYEYLQIPDQKPSVGVLKCQGWSKNAESQSVEYKPGDMLDASINQNMTLYAIWGPKIQVVYCDRISGSEKRAEEIIPRICAGNGGYIVRKNEGFTGYKQNGYKFRGWDSNHEVSPKTVRYPEEKECRVSFEELLSLAVKQNGGVYPEGKDTVDLRLYAVWDKVPEITADGIREFYEGVEVPRSELLSNVKAIDLEDGDITNQLRIVQIKYAAGKVSESGKQAEYEAAWEHDMPNESKLDTWFLCMEETDSPVQHEITYAVTDSAGNESLLKWMVKVRYNEYPEIEAKERYFTLEEAQSGVITEQVLLDEALETNMLKVMDKEDDVLIPGSMEANIKIQDFHSEEFINFQDAGFVTITYSVKDSMGPDGQGKETFRQCTIHIVEDGEIVTTKPVKYVRFINQKYFDKNQHIESDASEEQTNENGGLYPNSKWYRIPEYQELLSGSLNGSNVKKEVWKLSNLDVTNVKKYVNEHGIGNSKEEGALQKFLEKFKSLQKL